MASAASPHPLSQIDGRQESQLWSKTLRTLIEEQAEQYSGRTAVCFPSQGVRLTYKQLSSRSRAVAKALIASSLRHGQCVGIMAGNCYQYIELFLACGRIGCPFVVLNNTYSPRELLNAVTMSECRILCLAPSIGKKSLDQHIRAVRTSNCAVEQIVLFSETLSPSHKGAEIVTYNDFVANGTSTLGDDVALRQAEKQVQPSDALNLQFTSGTTGAPKAAVLTHFNLINNGRYIGDRMALKEQDIVCCPPPLFHCFGLVIGFLATFMHGSSIVFPSDQFDAGRVLDALAAEKCTALLGVPTMFIAELEANQVRKHKFTSLRLAVAAGSAVPAALVNKLQAEMGLEGVLVAYGMTETSPVTIMTSLTDSRDRLLRTVGTVMPHTGAKVVDRSGRIVSRGVRGEICTSGYALQKGYFRNEKKTKEVMKRDAHGVLWMHTGDEGVLDEEGYCTITGRIKDIIIRGGENIFPIEIEERLLAHESVGEACVVGIPDERYGEVVGCFLRQTDAIHRPSPADVFQWVSQTMGKHKAPKHVWWIGDSGVGDDFPKTGSGKYQKHILKDIGATLVKEAGPRARI